MSDWWSKKLSGGSSRETSVPPTQLPGRTAYHPYPQAPNPQIAYDANHDQTTVRAMSSRTHDRCPQCMSGNYMAPPGGGRMRCYECGYPIVQSGSGAGMPSDASGPATPARQTDQGGGFQPNVIVDRIG
jgi:ribosomal protein S27AE